MTGPLRSAEVRCHSSPKEREGFYYRVVAYPLDGERPKCYPIFMARKEHNSSKGSASDPMVSTSGIRIVWSGESWICHLPPAPLGLAPGTEYFATVKAPEKLPAVPTKPEAKTAPGRMMFPAGTRLYLPIQPKKNKAELIAIFNAVWAAGPFLRHRPKDHELVPIVLERDLCLENASESLKRCRCHIAGLPDKFESVNKLASWSIDRWTSRKTQSINVFEGVCFVDQKRLLYLRHRREYILRGASLPELSEEFQDTTLPLL